MSRTQISFLSPVTGPISPSCEMSAGDCKRADRLLEAQELGFEARCLGGWISDKGTATLVMMFIGDLPDFKSLRISASLNDILELFSENVGTDWQVTWSKEMVAP